MHKEFEISTLGELEEIAKYVVELTKNSTCFCFFAEMGAGKTTLISKICKLLGVKESTSSPTYSIVNEYIGENKEKIYHFDLYRLKNEAEIMDIGMLEIVDSDSLCFIEWPDIAEPYLPEDYVQVEIKVENAHRIINITH